MSIKVQTKECHTCGLVIEQWEDAYKGNVCIYCGSQLSSGVRVAPGTTSERETEVYKKYISNDPEKVKKYNERRNKEKERMHQTDTQPSFSEPECIPKCPTCGSTNIQLISAASRFGSAVIFGLASSKIGKTMECKNCGYKW